MAVKCGHHPNGNVSSNQDTSAPATSTPAKPIAATSRPATSRPALPCPGNGIRALMVLVLLVSFLPSVQAARCKFPSQLSFNAIMQDVCIVIEIIAMIAILVWFACFKMKELTAPDVPQVVVAPAFPYPDPSTPAIATPALPYPPVASSSFIRYEINANINANIN